MPTARLLRLQIALLVGLTGCAKRTQEPVTPPPSPRRAPAQRSTRPEPAPAPSPLQGALDRHIRSFGQNWGDAYRFSGYVLVAQDAKILYARGFGRADRGRRTPNGPDTSFRIGSSTKQFTAAAILLLADRGRLRLNDTVQQLLPSYRGPGAKVTVHHLLTHTSGIPDYTRDPTIMARRARAFRPGELLRLFASRPLSFTPGTRHAYSNSNYVVLGAIIERLSRKPYGKFLQDELFGPAGLKDTVYGDATATRDRATGYRVNGDERVVQAADIDLSFAYAAGGVRSTAHDMHRWAQALLGDEILGAQTRRRMFAPALGGYAYGWKTRTEDGVRIVQHGGTIDGFATEYILVPDRGLVVVVWSNTGEYANTVGRAALRAALGKPLQPRREVKPVALSGSETKRVTGTYSGPGGDRITVIQRKTLRIERKGQPSLRLHRAGAGRYFTKRAGLQVVFDLGSAGPARGLEIRQGKRSARYRRR